MIQFMLNVVYEDDIFFKVGFNAGDGEHYFSVPGSMTNSVLNLPQMSNIGVPGQFVFRVDQNKISNAGKAFNSLQYKKRYSHFLLLRIKKIM